MPTASAPTAQRVAYRQVCLSAEVLRGWAEVKKKRPKECGLRTSLSAEEMRSVALWAVEQPGVAEELGKRERKLLESKLGVWKDFEIRRGTWRTEVLAVLAWAQKDLSKQAPWGEHSTAAAGALERALKSGGLVVAAKPKLRPAGELRKAREEAEAWYERQRFDMLISGGCLTPAGKARVWTHLAAMLAAAAKQGVKVVDGDLGVGSIAFDFVKTDWDWTHGAYTIPSRLLAMRWLTGGGVWEETSLDMRAKINLRPGDLAVPKAEAEGVFTWDESEWVSLPI